VSSYDAYDEIRSYDAASSYDGPDGPSSSPNAFFTPRTLVNPPYLPDTPVGPALSLFRHYTPREMGVNVFLLSDLTLVQDFATPENQNTNVPYPYDATSGLPPIPFARVYAFTGVETDFNIDPYIVKVYYGGHYCPITADEIALLTAAGYAADLLDFYPDDFNRGTTFEFGGLTLYRD
jgi:hypothetical protein